MYLIIAIVAIVMLIKNVIGLTKEIKAKFLVSSLFWGLLLISYLFPNIIWKFVLLLLLLLLLTIKYVKPVHYFAEFFVFNLFYYKKKKSIPVAANKHELPIDDNGLLNDLQKIKAFNPTTRKTDLEIEELTKLIDSSDEVISCKAESVLNHYYCFKNRNTSAII